MSPALHLVLALASAAPRPLGDRVVVVPLAVDGDARAAVDAGTASMIEALVVQEVGTRSKACVVTPRHLRDIGRNPIGTEPICGVPPAQAIASPYMVHSRFGKRAGKWELEVQLVEQQSGRIPAKDTLVGSESAAVLRQLPQLIAALVDTVANDPRPTARLLGVVAAPGEGEGAVPPGPGCSRGDGRAIDAEADVTWAAPAQWFVARYGAEPVERVRRDTALGLAREAARREAVGGAYLWVLAQLGERPRTVIHARGPDFEAWSAQLLADGNRFVQEEHLVNEDVQAPRRAAKVVLRTCVDTAVLQQAVARQVELLDPAGKPSLVIFADEPDLAATLRELSERFGFGPRAAETVDPLPDLGGAAGRGRILQTIARQGAGAALLADSEVLPAGDGTEVRVQLTVVGPGGEILGGRTLVTRPEPGRRELARVLAAWRRGSSPELEDLLLSLRRK